MAYQRFAIYVTLPEGPLASFGAAWLGWDAAAGRHKPPPRVPGLRTAPHRLTRTPRRYGLHGTIKAPFQLADGTDEAALRTALAELCADSAPVELPGLTLSRIGGFLALVPYGDTAALDALAARAVADLDRFRAPMGAEERDRRNAHRLSPSQQALLEQWGYPYVMQEFRFHMTLTGRLPASEAAHVQEALAAHLEPLLPRPFRIEALSLCGEDEAGMFHVLDRVALFGNA